MKLYKFKLEMRITHFHIYPFAFVDDWLAKIKLLYLEWRLARHFKRLNWSWDDVWKKTSFCGSLNEAIEQLAYEIANSNYILLPKARKLISAGYDRHWK